MTMRIYNCCQRGKELGRGFAGDDVPGAPDDLLLIEAYEPPKASFSTCVHEAGHACAAIAIGGEVIEVMVSGRNVSRSHNRGNIVERAAVMMAGTLAENRLARRRITASNEAVIELLDRAAAGACGLTCDECLIGRRLSFGPTDDEIGRGLAAFRGAEALALRMVEDPAFWRAVIAIADALDERQTLIGETVHLLAERFIAPGSFALTPIENQ